MWNSIGWYGFIGVITTSTTDISLNTSVHPCQVFYVHFVRPTAWRPLSGQMLCPPLRRTNSVPFQGRSESHLLSVSRAKAAWNCLLQKKTVCVLDWQTRPRGYETWVHSQTQNKAHWLVACGHASSQSLCSISSVRLIKQRKPRSAWYVFNLSTFYILYHLKYGVGIANSVNTNSTK